MFGVWRKDVRLWQHSPCSCMSQRVLIGWKHSWGMSSLIKTFHTIKVLHYVYEAPCMDHLPAKGLRGVYCIYMEHASYIFCFGVGWPPPIVQGVQLYHRGGIVKKKVRTPCLLRVRPLCVSSMVWIRLCVEQQVHHWAVWKAGICLFVSCFSFFFNATGLPAFGWAWVQRTWS